MNVSLTRAKYALYIVGHMKTLTVGYIHIVNLTETIISHVNYKPKEFIS